MSKHVQYKLTNCVEEDHKKPIFCICFNFVDPRHQDLLASVGGNRATIYRVLPKSGAFEVVQAYVEENKDEQFFTCKWSCSVETGAPLLLLAGHTGVVRVIDCHQQRIVQTLAGHGNSVNDLVVVPQQPELLFTASKDETIRLWNLRTGCCVLILAGEGGHKNEVLSMDFHPWDECRLISSGMDFMIKIWSLAGLQEHLNSSFAWRDSTRSFPTKHLHHPLFSSVQVHGNYVDCVRWCGDLVLSKSVDQFILLWKPDDHLGNDCHTASSFTLLQEFSLPDSFQWWLRFSLNFSSSLLACGNTAGKVLVYAPLGSDGAPRAKLSIHPPHSKSSKKSSNCDVSVRQTAISWDGSIILAACEDGTIHRWDAED